MKISALVPAKKNSHRIPNKNLTKIGDKTLLEHKIIQLSNSQIIDNIYVGTDSKEIADIANKYNVDIIYRDPVCCDESKSTANMMIKDFASRISCDIAVWAHLTNPFVEHTTYDDAIKQFLLKESENFDSLISVSKIQEHLWNTDYTPMNYNPWAQQHTLAKDLPVYYKQTGAFFIQRHQQMLNNSYFFGKKPFLYCTTELESLDINTKFDLLLAQTIYHELFFISK